MIALRSFRTSKGWVFAGRVMSRTDPIVLAHPDKFEEAR